MVAVSAQHREALFVAELLTAKGKTVNYHNAKGKVIWSTEPL